MKIVHIITSLGDGGAEHTLFKICKYDTKNEHTVISLRGPGKYSLPLRKMGIRVYFLNMSFYSFFKFLILIKLLRFLKPDIVQTWLVHADFIGGIAAKLIGIKNIIWNIRYSNLEYKKTKLLTIFLIRLLSKLSYFIPKQIVIVSKKAKKIYEVEGYDKKKLKFIPNGYDLNLLKPKDIEKKKFKKKISKQLPIIGNVARYDPKKDHLNLIKALSLIRYKKIDFLCFFSGSEVNQNNLKITSEIKKLKLEKKIKLIGQNDNILQIMNGIDLYVQSSSYGEGFPNVVAESMACGTPCVVTDVGDASLIVGKSGWVVPPNDPNKLAKAIEIALKEIKTRKWNKRCKRARLRIKTNFDISKMIKSYNELWYQVYNKKN